MSKKNLLILTLALFSTLAFAQESAESKKIEEPVTKNAVMSYAPGRNSLRIGGNLGYSTYGGSFVRLSPRLERFIIPQLSVGGALSVSASSYDSFTSLSAGPAATYYFFNKNAFSSYVSAAYILEFFSKYNLASSHLHFDLGMNYNFNENFGLGPKFSYYQYRNSSALELNLGLFFYF